MSAEDLAEILGCEFNEWGECRTHDTPANPRGYDDPTCPALSAVGQYLTARVAAAEAEAETKGLERGWDEGCSHTDDPNDVARCRANPYRAAMPEESND